MDKFIHLLFLFFFCYIKKTAIKISEDSSINLFEYDYGLNYNSKIRLISGNYIKIGKKQRYYYMNDFKKFFFEINKY